MQRHIFETGPERIAFVKADAARRAKTGHQRRRHEAWNVSAKMPMLLEWSSGRCMFRRAAEPAVVAAVNDPADAHTAVAVVIVVAAKHVSERTDAQFVGIAEIDGDGLQF